LQHASNDWVLFLDADERITPALQSEIITTLNDPDKKDAYYFKRLFFFAGKPIHFSGTQGDNTTFPNAKYTKPFLLKEL